jgi:phosphoglycolate phosphatase
VTHPAVDDPDALRQVLAEAEALLLDFDGPICSVFAGFPALVIADQLRAILSDGGHPAPEATDPFDVLDHARALGPDEARYVEAAFTAHEAEAITTARPTPGAHELMAAWHAAGRPLAIVSNNSETAISAYLDLHDLRRYVTHVSARTGPTTPLKPATHLIDQAVSALHAFPAQVVLVGDSTTDITAAATAGARSIGYANKPAKLATLTAAGAHLIITTITALCDAV